MSNARPCTRAPCIAERGRIMWNRAVNGYRQILYSWYAVLRSPRKTGWTYQNQRYRTFHNDSWPFMHATFMTIAPHSYNLVNYRFDIYPISIVLVPTVSKRLVHKLWNPKNWNSPKMNQCLVYPFWFITIRRPLYVSWLVAVNINVSTSNFQKYLQSKFLKFCLEHSLQI